LSRGISTVIFFKLCSRAPTTRNKFWDINTPRRFLIFVQGIQ
jgi:hypothetical protein